MLSSIKEAILKIFTKNYFKSLAIFVSLFMVLGSQAQAATVKIVYTGQTHAALYPCHCPKSRDGGLTRRAQAIKDLRAKDPGLIVLDAGSFFAGGIFDEYSLNVDSDILRSRVNFKAMELMGYSAVSISEDEFNLGYPFLKDIISGSQIPFISSNIKVEKSAPFLILESNGVKIGVIGLTNIPASVQLSKNPAAIEYIKAAKEAISGLKNQGAQIIIILSSLDRNDVIRLLDQVKDADIFINANSKFQDLPENSLMGRMIMLNTFWQGRSIGELSLDVSSGKIKSWSMRKIGLSAKISDNKQVSAILPRCFIDSDCFKEGSRGVCENSGTLKSRCNFTAYKTVNLTVIRAKDQAALSGNQTMEFLKWHFPGLKVAYLDYPQKPAQALASELAIKSLPAYIFNKDVQAEEGFKRLGQPFRRNKLFFGPPEYQRQY
jgi:2',3'-cyclic-nucleotide 2'-phosphodiesterase (5'-nucleotidase family)